MVLRTLELANVRNYPAIELELSAGLNVFVGANGQGKSNLIEAIALLGTGKSFRTPREGEIIRTGLPSASMMGTARVASGEIRLSCTLANSSRGVRKTYTVNGRGVRYAGYLGRLRVVSFVPAHLALIGGPPAGRRSLLNAALAQESPSYYATLATYQAYLSQKNALLRGQVEPDETLLRTYDERLIETGTVLMLARRRYAAALDERARAAYRGWTSRGEPELSIRYAPNVESDGLSETAIAAAFAERLVARRLAEFTRRTSLVGPHRDDLTIELGGVSLGAYGSQGQQRTAVLALKVAEYGVLEARAGEAPLLLLDDVLSELDADRQRAFLRSVGGFEQAFVTTTHDVDVPVAARFRIVAGAVEAGER